jgi:hypothetical protein
VEEGRNDFEPEQVVHRDHVRVVARIPGLDPLHLRLSGRQPLEHRRFDEQADPVSPVLPGHRGQRLVSPFRCLRLNRDLRHSGDLSGSAVYRRDRVLAQAHGHQRGIRAVPEPVGVKVLRLDADVVRRVPVRVHRKGHAGEVILGRGSRPGHQHVPGRGLFSRGADTDDLPVGELAQVKHPECRADPWRCPSPGGERVSRQPVAYLTAQDEPPICRSPLSGVP